MLADRIVATSVASVTGALLFACGASQTNASVTLAPANVDAGTPSIAAACPSSFALALDAPCHHIGDACNYPEAACTCREVAYCGSGVVRPGPPPPATSILFACTVTQCASAAQGAPCTLEGFTCRTATCFTPFVCRGGRWSSEAHGPPP